MLIGLFLVISPVLSGSSSAQEFRYQVPMAPEFDSRGNLIESAHSYASEPPAGGNSDTYHQSRGQTRQAEHDQLAPQPRNASAPVGMAVTAHRRTTARSARGVPGSMQTGQIPGPQMQTRARPDCSQYPMAIARAQNDAEMQALAKEFLTCLMMNGMDQEQAKQHVLPAIKTYEMARQ